MDIYIKKLSLTKMEKFGNKLFQTGGLLLLRYKDYIVLIIVIILFLLIY